jgi:hypothetical protein
MLSRLKQRSEADAPPAVPAWHPNFRNYQKLPDIKVVRTAFFLNGVAVLVAIALGAYLGFREWQVWHLNKQIADLQAQINRDKRLSDQAIALFKTFQAEEAKVNEVDVFLNARPKVLPLILRIAETLPKNIALDNFDLRDSGMTLRLSVRGGDAAAASGQATAYREQLRADKALAAFEEPTFTGTPTINPATGRLSVEFLLRSKAKGKK